MAMILGTLFLLYLWNFYGTVSQECIDNKPFGNVWNNNQNHTCDFFVSQQLCSQYGHLTQSSTGLSAHDVCCACIDTNTTNITQSNYNTNTQHVISTQLQCDSPGCSSTQLFNIFGQCLVCLIPKFCFCFGSFDTNIHRMTLFDKKAN